MKKNDRVIPKKNYLYLVIMLVLVVIITFFIFEMNKKYHERKLESSYLDGYVSEVNVSDLNNILTEPNSEQFILITKTGSEEIYKLETELKKVIKSRDLRDNFIYIDYTDKENDIEELNKILNSDIKTIPAVVYYKDGEYVKTIDSSLSILNSGEFEKLLDEYEVN